MNDWSDRKDVLTEVRDRESRLWQEAKILIDCTERELKGLVTTGWITRQPGPDANFYAFPTEEEWRAKIRQLEALLPVLQEERARHGLRLELASRELYSMSWGPPGSVCLCVKPLVPEATSAEVKEP